MGNAATPESLVVRWGEVQRDPALQDLPYKIELNSWGKVEMSPASFRHGRLQAALSAELIRQRPDGVTATEVSILTRIGIRVPDVIWASADFMRRFGEITPLMQAPEICVEVISPSNLQAEIDAKRQAYFEAGAREVWIVSEDGSIRYFDQRSENTASSFVSNISLPLVKGNP